MDGERPLAGARPEAVELRGSISIVIALKPYSHQMETKLE